MSARRPEIVYVYMGNVERGGLVGGYSRDGKTYPWVTKKEAWAEARAEGAKAVFR